MWFFKKSKPRRRTFIKSKPRRRGLLLNGVLTNAFGDTKPFPIDADVLYETQSQYKIDIGYWNGGTYWVKKHRVKIIGEYGDEQLQKQLAE